MPRLLRRVNGDRRRRFRAPPPARSRSSHRPTASPRDRSRSLSSSSPSFAFRTSPSGPHAQILYLIRSSPFDLSDMALTRLMSPRPPCSLPLPSPSYKNISGCCCHRGRRLLVRRAMPVASQHLSTATPLPPPSPQRQQMMARLEHGSLMVGGRELLARAPPNVTLRPADAEAAPGAAFLGARAAAPSSRHVFPVGTLASGWRWLSLFRFKIWWMVPATGAGAATVPAETQMLLLESRDEEGSAAAEGGAVYALMLPALDGDFRVSLQGSPENELQFCLESGDPEVQTMEAVDAVFINSGDNPFKLMKESIKLLSKIKGNFKHIGDKEIPANLDWFGWCTWDAFYKAVNPAGIEEGLKR